MICELLPINSVNFIVKSLPPSFVNIHKHTPSHFVWTSEPLQSMPAVHQAKPLYLVGDISTGQSEACPRNQAPAERGKQSRFRVHIALLIFNLQWSCNVCNLQILGRQHGVNYFLLIPLKGVQFTRVRSPSLFSPITIHVCCVWEGVRRGSQSASRKVQTRYKNPQLFSYQYSMIQNASWKYKKKKKKKM